MDDFIILPDDKTMEKLATEYAKIRAKTFADGHYAVALSTDGEKTENLPAVTDDADTRKPYPCNNYFLVTVISALILKSIKFR